MSLRRYYELLFLTVIFSLFIIGFLGPKFWKIPQPLFNFKSIQNNFSNPVVSIDRLNLFCSNNNYLSSDQFNNKVAVLNWSKNILNYVSNDVPIPRMYGFSSIKICPEYFQISYLGSCVFILSRRVSLVVSSEYKNLLERVLLFKIINKNCSLICFSRSLA